MARPGDASPGPRPAPGTALFPAGRRRALLFAQGLALAAALLLLACGRPTPPRVPPVPRDKIEAPTEPEPRSLEIERELTPPPTSTKNMAQLIYDPVQPCFTRGQVDRAREVLFVDFRHDDEMKWLNALNTVFYGLSVNCEDDDFLMLVLTTIQIESGVNVDPKIENPDLERMFAIKLQTFSHSNGLLGRLITMSGLEEALRNKLRADTEQGLVRTEADLLRYFHNNLRPWLIGYFNEKFRLPLAVAERVVDAGLPNPVNSIGPMQVNVEKAYRFAIKRGEHVDSVEEMQARLLDPGTALERGLKEGVYMLWRTFKFYRRYLDGSEAVVFASADFNGGEFSSRNAAFQERLTELTGKPLLLDGDLLLYRNGEPLEAQSNSEAAVNAALTLDAGEIRRDLLLEKDPEFWDTDTARQLCAALQTQKNLPCRVARLPSGAENELATLKHGSSFSPATYARKFYRIYRKNSAHFLAMGPSFMLQEHLARLQRTGDTNPH